MTRNRRSRQTRALVILAAIALVSSLVLAPLFTSTAAAQATTTTTNTTNSTNQSESNHWFGGGLGVNLSGISLGVGLGGGGGKYSKVCGGGMQGMVCQGVMTAVSELVSSFFDKLLKTLQQGAEELVKMLINRPVPERNGNPAFAGQPTNEPMKTAYNVWLNTGLVGGLILWAFFMLLRYFSIGMPNGAAGTRAGAKKQLLKGSFDGLNILASWILAAIVLHLSVGFALWVAPEGPQIIKSFDTLIDHASAVGVSALILWFSSGFIFAMAVIVFGLGIVAPLLLAPMQPIFIGLSMTPRVWLFKYIAEFGEQARGWFVPAAFAPVPTAMILGFGYPILNAFRGVMSGPFESFVGVPTYVIGLVIMWFAALSAPLALFAKSRHVRPLAMAGMAAAGAMSGISMSNRLSGLRNRFSSVGGNTTSNAASSSATGMGTAAGRVDPIKGNPLAGETSASASGLGSADSDARSVGSGTSSALGGGAAPPAASQSASGSETATPGEASAIGASEASGTTTARTSSSTTSETSESAYTRAGSSARSTTTGAAGGPERTTNVTAGSSDDEKINVVDRGIHEVTTSEELPTGQEYEGGYERSDGLYEDALDGTHRRNFLLQRYDSLAIHNFDGPMLLKGEEDGQFYDVTTAVEEGRVPNGSATHEESQNVVQNTR